MSDSLKRPRELLERARDAERRGETARALGLYDDVIAQFGEADADPLLADALRWKGTVLRERGETESAHRCYVRSLISAERCDSIGRQAHALNCLAIVAQRRGESRDTDALYAKAADLASRANESRLLGMIEQNRGVLADMRGDLADAEARYTQSLSAFENAGDNEAASWVLNNLGMLLTKQGEFGRAHQALQRGLAIAREADPGVEAIFILNLAELSISSGNLERAAEESADALERAQKRGDHLTAAGALRCKARVERAHGALDKSLATLRIALYEAEGTEDRLLRAELLREFGDVSRALGDARSAKSAWVEAAASFERVGARKEADDIKSQLSSLGG